MANKRILDPAYWRSTKLSRVQPESLRLHYANWICQASASGSFEWDARRLWSEVYAYLLPSFSVEDVEAIANEFDAAACCSAGATRAERPGRISPASIVLGACLRRAVSVKATKSVVRRLHATLSMHFSRTGTRRLRRRRRLRVRPIRKRRKERTSQTSPKRSCPSGTRAADHCRTQSG